MTFYTYRSNVAWCPKRATSLIILGLAAAGCSAACAALTATFTLGWSSKIKAATVGMQISMA